MAIQATGIFLKIFVFPLDIPYNVWYYKDT